MNNPTIQQPEEIKKYSLRPLSLTVEEIAEMDLIHEGQEMDGQVDIKLTQTKARELFTLLGKKLMQDPDSFITLSLRGPIK